MEHKMNQIRIKPTLFFGMLYLIFGAGISVAVNRNEIPLPGSVYRTIAGARDIRRLHIEAGQSHFVVHAFVSGLLSGFGHNHNIEVPDINGELQYTDETVAPASLVLRIRADSLTVIDKVSAKDKTSIETTMREEVLETSKYPEITFSSTKVDAAKTGDGQYQATITGDFNVHGVSRPGVINAQLSFSGNMLRARGEFPLKMTDYNIKPPSVAGGTIKVKDILKLTFDIVAR
jgi:polyisoprenoid-binding protein YceI